MRKLILPAAVLFMIGFCFAQNRWLDDVAIDSSSVTQEHSPSLCLDSDLSPVIFAAYEKWDSNQPRDIYVKKSADDGANWNLANNISGTISIFYSAPKLTNINSTDLGVLYLKHNSPNDTDIIFSRITKSDLTILPAIHIDDNAATDAILTRASISSDYVYNVSTPSLYCVYVNASSSPMQLKFSKSSDAGETWSTPANIASINAATPVSSLHTSIDVNDNLLIISYVERVGSSDAVKSIRSLNGGNTWSVPNVIASSSSFHYRYPDILITGPSRVHVVYERAYLSGWDETDAYYNISNDLGNTFLPSSQFNSFITYQSHEKFPTFACRKTGTSYSDLHLAYYEMDTASVKVSRYANNSWLMPQQIKDSDNQLSPSDMPSLVVKTNSVNVSGPSVAWCEYANNDLNNSNIMFDSNFITEPCLYALPDTLSFGQAILNTTTQYYSFTVQGLNLSSNVSISAPAGFAISQAWNGPYTTSAILFPLNGIIETMIYVKFSPTQLGVYLNQITINSDSVQIVVFVNGKGVLPRISGTILRNYNIPFSGVALNGLPFPTTTNSAGYYSCYVPLGWSGSVTPSYPGYTFYPESRNYTDVETNQPYQNFTGNLVHVWK
jgi:hypothetical protein